MLFLFTLFILYNNNLPQKLVVGHVNVQEISNNKFIYLLHMRKAGGTTLCMSYRRSIDPSVSKRKTCQLLSLCGPDCDILNVLNINGLKLKKYLEKHLNSENKKLIEVEGSSLPTNISQWMGNWDFITSIRHPVDRIVSDILHHGFATKKKHK